MNTTIYCNDGHWVQNGKDDVQWALILWVERRDFEVQYGLESSVNRRGELEFFDMSRNWEVV